MDRGCASCEEEQKKGTPSPRPTAIQSRKTQSQAIYSVLLPPKLLLNFPHPKADTGPTDPEDTASSPMCHKEDYSQYHHILSGLLGPRGEGEIGEQ